MSGPALALALTVAGLDHLHRVDGTPVGMLYVEADNAPARGLYDRMGFAMHHRDRVYLTDVG